MLIAIIQNPAIKTDDGKRFSDMFPSGQYVKYLGEVAYQSVEGQGPIMIDNEKRAQEASDADEAPGEAPGSDVNARPVLARDVTQHPLTRTDIIVAALTAINTAMGADANIVAAGGAAVSYYIYDFVQHCKLIISVNVNGLQPDASEAIVAGVEKTFEDFIRDVHVQDEAFRLTVDSAAFIGKFGTQLSLVLRIGDVFNVPVFTAYVMRDVFNNAVLDSDHESVGGEFMHNAKLITNYSRLDVLLELLLHAASPDPYDTVNVLIARGINALIVSQFAQQSPTPNAVIQTECGKFFFCFRKIFPDNFRHFDFFAL